MNRILLLPLVLLAACEPSPVREARDIVRANPAIPNARPEFQSLEYVSAARIICGEVRWVTATGATPFGAFHIINGAVEYPMAPPAAAVDPFWARDAPCKRAGR